MAGNKPTKALHNWTCVNTQSERWLVGYDQYGQRTRTGSLLAFDAGGRSAEDAEFAYILGEAGPPASGKLELETK